ncbi:MAG: M23 family metallopeptidase [Patescibacteria group bacterium]
MDNSGIGQLDQLKRNLIDALGSNSPEDSFSIARKIRQLARQLKVKSSDPTFDNIVNNLASGSTESIKSAQSYFGLKVAAKKETMLGRFADRYLPKVAKPKNKLKDGSGTIEETDGDADETFGQPIGPTNESPGKTDSEESGADRYVRQASGGVIRREGPEHDKFLHDISGGIARKTGPEHDELLRQISGGTVRMAKTGAAQPEKTQKEKKPKEKLAVRMAKKYQDAVKKFRVAMKAAQLIAKLVPILLNPVTWAIIGGVIVLVILLGLGLSYFGAGSAGVGGSTQQQNANLINDNNVITKVLLLNGDEDIKAVMTNDFFNKLRRELTDYRAATTSSEKQTKIDEIINEIGLYLNDPTLEQGKKVISLCQEVLRYQGIPVIAGVRTKKPLDTIVGYNSALHGGEIINGKSAGYHSLYAVGNTRDVGSGGICDAVDLYSGEVGVAVYPFFDGNVVKVFDDHPGPNREEQKVVVIESGRYRAYLAHLRDVSKRAGDTVNIDESIGKTGKIGGSRPQVHLELLYKQNDGNYRCATTTDVDKIEAKQTSKPKGFFLWRTMANILNINLGSQV